MTRWLLLLATGCWTSSAPTPVAPTPAPVVVESPPPAPAPAPAAQRRTFHTQQPIGSPPSSGSSQASIANRANNEGVAAFAHGKFSDASSKFREAVARVPEVTYFFNLCVALYNEGRFDEALTACDAGRRNAPTAELDAKLAEQRDQILDEAHAQQIELRH